MADGEITGEITVRDRPERRQFEVLVGGEIAGVAQYVRRPGRIIFVHTQVREAYEGRGLGGRLAAGALEAARAEGAKVVPLCPYIEAYIGKHPEHADLVDAELMAQLDG